jgi:hypothetical protein
MWQEQEKRSVKPSALPCQQLLICHRTLCGVMRKLRARMADMGTVCYLCAWPVLKRRIGDLRAASIAR